MSCGFCLCRSFSYSDIIERSPRWVLTPYLQKEKYNNSKHQSQHKNGSVNSGVRSEGGGGREVCVMFKVNGG